MVPTRATQRSIGFDLHAPTRWMAGPDIKDWHAVTIHFAGHPPVLYMTRVTTPAGRPSWGPSTIVEGPHVPQEIAEATPIERVILHSGGRVGIDHGVHLQVNGCYGVIKGRSGTRKKGVSILGDGIIDPDYPGHLNSWLWNVSPEDFVITPGQALTQLVIHPLPPCHLTTNPALIKQTTRTAGFGSTDKQDRAHASRLALLGGCSDQPGPCPVHGPMCHECNGVRWVYPRMYTDPTPILTRAAKDEPSCGFCGLLTCDLCNMEPPK